MAVEKKTADEKRLAWNAYIREYNRRRREEKKAALQQVIVSILEVAANETVDVIHRKIKTKKAHTIIFFFTIVTPLYFLLFFPVDPFSLETLMYEDFQNIPIQLLRHYLIHIYNRQSLHFCFAPKL